MYEKNIIIEYVELWKWFNFSFDKLRKLYVALYNVMLGIKCSLLTETITLDSNFLK